VRVFEFDSSGERVVVIVALDVQAAVDLTRRIQETISVSRHPKLPRTGCEVDRNLGPWTKGFLGSGSEYIFVGTHPGVSQMGTEITSRRGHQALGNRPELGELRLYAAVIGADGCAAKGLARQLAAGAHLFETKATRQDAPHCLSTARDPKSGLGRVGGDSRPGAVSR